MRCQPIDPTQRDLQTLKTWNLLWHPDSAVEIRIPGAAINRKTNMIESVNYRSTVGGWFDNYSDFNAWVKRIGDVSPYVCLNPCNHSLLSRVLNRIDVVKNTTSDLEIDLRRFAFVDIDPVRPAGISSTDAELASAVELRNQIVIENPEFRGISTLGISGNGAFIWIPIELENTLDSGTLVTSFLSLLSRRYSTDKVKIDVKTSNAARIAALPGTRKCKGENTDLRPWRYTLIDPESSVEFCMSQDTRKVFNICEYLASQSKDIIEPRSKKIVVGQIQFADAKERARRFANATPGAVSGQNGHAQAYKTACAIGPGFDLDYDVAFEIYNEWNAKCDPRWSVAEIHHKLTQAYANESRRGWLLEKKPNDGSRTAALTSPVGNAAQQSPVESAPTILESVVVTENCNDPHVLSRNFLANFQHPDRMRLLTWQGATYRWRDGSWQVWPHPEFVASVTKSCRQQLDLAFAQEYASDPTAKPLPVTKAMVGNVVNAIASETTVEVSVCRSQPCWISTVDGEEISADPKNLIPCPNAIVNLERIDWPIKPTPSLFVTQCAGCDYLPNSQQPENWLKFLESVWPEDGESILLLQEWFGYCLTPDTSLQTLLCLIGATRTGKGTMTRILTRLVGESNVCFPTFSSMIDQYGMMPFPNSSLAIFSDARLSGRHDSVQVSEKLLSISGEDGQQIGMKYTSPWIGKLSTRLMLVSNEELVFPDSSNALASRTRVLVTTRSFAGREDRELEARLVKELPSILNWSIEGWKRLKRNCAFTRPQSSIETEQSMASSASPIREFVFECCAIDSSVNVRCTDLYKSWCDWCKANNVRQDRIGCSSEFGRTLRAAFPEISTTNPIRSGGSRSRYYRGIQLANSLAF